MYPSIWPTGCGLAASLRASPAAPSSPPCQQPSPWPAPPSRPPLFRMRCPRPNGLVPPSCSSFLKQRNAAFLKGKPWSAATAIHPKDEHKSVPWVQDTAWAGDLWCVSTSFHTDSPSALTGFPVKLGDVGEGYANVAGAARQEIRAQGAFFCSRQYFRWVHTGATRRDTRDALRGCTARGNPMTGSSK
jgi:hypothetical protein